MPPENLDQLARHRGDAVDDRPEVGAAGNDVVELHLPCCRCRRVNEARRGSPQQLEYLQPCRCRHHEIAIRQVGFRDVTQSIEVTPGGTTIVTVRMVKDPNAVTANATGEVKLKVNPDRAAVFVDGNHAGYVHQFGGVKRAMLIAPGKHHIEIALPGYRDFETEIVVQVNQKVTVKTSLTPASITAEGSELK